MNVESISTGKLVSCYATHHRLYSILLEIQSQCNWRCKHCYVDDFSYSLPTDDIFDLLPILRNLGCYEITITGGEVFLRKDIMEIIRIIRQSGFNLVIFSNISLLNEEMIQKLSLYKIGLVSCSLFSMNPQIHDSITQVSGSFQKTYGNLMLLKKYHVPVQVKTIVMKPNYESFFDLTTFCDAMEFEFKPDFAVYRKLNGDAQNQKLMLDGNLLQHLIRDADDIVGFTPVYTDRETDFVCEQIQHSLSVDWYGDIHPCNRLPCVLGNIKTDDIEKIWNESTELREIANTRWKDLPHCRDCDKKPFCVRCAGGAMEEFGNRYFESTVACRIAMARKLAYDVGAHRENNPETAG